MLGVRGGLAVLCWHRADTTLHKHCQRLCWRQQLHKYWACCAVAWGGWIQAGRSAVGWLHGSLEGLIGAASMNRESQNRSLRTRGIFESNYMVLSADPSWGSEEQPCGAGHLLGRAWGGKFVLAQFSQC
jgi:hypothetical protein